MLPSLIEGNLHSTWYFSLSLLSLPSLYPSLFHYPSLSLSPSISLPSLFLSLLNISLYLYLSSLSFCLPLSISSTDSHRSIFLSLSISSSYWLPSLFLSLFISPSLSLSLYISPISSSYSPLSFFLPLFLSLFFSLSLSPLPPSISPYLFLSRLTTSTKETCKFWASCMRKDNSFELSEIARCQLCLASQACRGFDILPPWVSWF